jgi:hypothetical protein
MIGDNEGQKRQVKTPAETAHVNICLGKAFAKEPKTYPQNIPRKNPNLPKNILDIF